MRSCSSAGPRPAMRSRSVAESSTWKSLGTRRRWRLSTWALLSHSRWSAAEISTGWTALRKARAKTPEMSSSRRCSNRCSAFISCLLSSRVRRAGFTAPPCRCRRAYRPVSSGSGSRPGPPRTAWPLAVPTTTSHDLQPIGRASAPWGSLSSLLARVAERQTRWLQVPVSERAWGFKSPLAHQHRRPRITPGPFVTSPLPPIRTCVPRERVCRLWEPRHGHCSLDG